MFLFKFFAFILGGVVRVGLLVVVGAWLLNSTSNAVSDIDSKQRNEKVIEFAKAASSEAKYQLAVVMDELSKYEVIVVKHEK